MGIKETTREYRLKKWAGIIAELLLLAVFVLALPKTFAKTCSHVLPHNGLKFGTSQDAKL